MFQSCILLEIIRTSLIKEIFVVVEAFSNHYYWKKYFEQNAFECLRKNYVDIS